MSPPPGFGLIETGDGSFTFFSEAFNEACHSISGAKTETALYYVEGCGVKEKREKGLVTILEVGFGLGVGFLTTLEELKDGFHFISLELDRNLLDWFKDQHPELGLQWNGNILSTETKDYKLTIIQGDARTTLPSYLEAHPVKWDAIYQDAFSPKKSPSLWTTEWFELLKAHSNTDVVLSTYSSSSSIRKSLYETGWGVLRGSAFGVKKTSTRAVLNRETETDIVLQLQRSPVDALTDSNMKYYK